MKRHPRGPLFSEAEWTRLKEHLGLPPGQAELARHISCGKSEDQIADEMGISITTVQAHLAELLQRFGVADRADLVLALFACFRELAVPPENAHEHAPKNEPH